MDGKCYMHQLHRKKSTHGSCKKSWRPQDSIWPNCNLVKKMWPGDPGWIPVPTSCVANFAYCLYTVLRDCLALCFCAALFTVDDVCSCLFIIVYHRIGCSTNKEQRSCACIMVLVQLPPWMWHSVVLCRSWLWRRCVTLTAYSSNPQKGQTSRRMAAIHHLSTVSPIFEPLNPSI